MLCQSPFTQLNSFRDCKQLYQFLNFCKQRSIETNQFKIASIALETDSIDPLVVLEQFSKPDQLHFYFENRDQGRAIAALDTALSFEETVPQRFLNAQKFIQTSWEHLISSSPLDLAWKIPRFFCSFTFFEQEVESKSAFPSATVFLPKWQITRWQNHTGLVINWLIDSQSDLDEITQTIWQQFKRMDAIQHGLLNFSAELPNLFKQWEIVDAHNFQAAVTAALDSIQNQQFDKLVLAHAIDVVSRLPFQWVSSLHHLRQLHPDCCVFSSGNRQGQRFIGASPERLLSIQKQKLITDALAGSAARGPTVVEDADLAQRLLSNDKEQREHQVVVRFITQQLVNLGLRPQFSSNPGLLQLSNIQHLHTPIQATIPNTLHPLEVLAALHPTPAVAGMPRAIACQQIRQYEQFERSLYAAPLGWIDAQNNAEFIVGIRSALLEGHHARLYAGAGIVAGSDPERELAEIKLKFQALLRAIV